MKKKRYPGDHEWLRLHGWIRADKAGEELWTKRNTKTEPQPRWLALLIQKKINDKRDLSK